MNFRVQALTESKLLGCKREFSLNWILIKKQAKGLNCRWDLNYLSSSVSERPDLFSSPPTGSFRGAEQNPGGRLVTPPPEKEFPILCSGHCPDSPPFAARLSSRIHGRAKLMGRPPQTGNTFWSSP